MVVQTIEIFSQCGTNRSSGWLLVAETGTPVTTLLIPALHRSRPGGKLKYMKRVYFYLIVILLLIGAIYIWERRSDYSVLREWIPARQADGVIDTAQSLQLEWHPVDETAQGFKIEMPGDPSHVIVQADNETGATEPIRMLVVKPDTDRTYAIAWADKPPIARMNDLVPDKTLDQARDGALNRTQTTPISEVRSNPQGFPGRDVVAHNVGGGILDTRFIYAGTRLYMLIATAPSSATRREQDVTRFFNSRSEEHTSE